jgi:acyl-CoA thioesterase I
MQMKRFSFTDFCLVTCIFFLSFFVQKQSAAQWVSVENYPSVIKVACIGNSITYGSGIEHRDSLSYPAQLGRMLGEKWEVKNFGVGGRTLLTKGDRPYIREKAYTDALNFLPDVVLIKLGTNDTKPHNWKHKDEFMDDYRALVESFRNLETKPIVILLKAVPAFPERWGISDSLIRTGVNPMVGELASGLGLQVIDLYKALEHQGDLFPDQIHPNAKGAEIMARTIYAALTGKE